MVKLFWLLLIKKDRYHMLAYAFWHWPRPQVENRLYQENLINFHRTLARQKPTGFHFSRCLLVAHASWLGRGEMTYEDWSIVENSAALDTLNDGAVTGICQEPHRAVAQWTAGSGAGLYRFHSGVAALPAVQRVYRFDKPADLTYAELFANLHPLLLDGRGGLWVRQMNLGPGPEFCLQSFVELALPQNLQVLDIPAQQVWSGILN
jgi:hypothetical protein